MYTGVDTVCCMHICVHMCNVHVLIFAGIGNGSKCTLAEPEIKVRHLPFSIHF